MVSKRDVDLEMVGEIESEIAEKVRKEVPKHVDLVTNTRGLVGIKESMQTDGCVREIMERIVRGQSIRQICTDPHMPSEATVYKWIQYDPDFRALYEQASRLRLGAFAEQIIDLADDDSKDMMVNSKGGIRLNPVSVQRDALKVKTRMWLLERLNRERYSVQSSGGGDSGMRINVILPDNNRPILDITDDKEKDKKP